ncbi:S-layer homology domain-containing protein [uncultured Peptoniphilus sp.]|uniref:S-layer homology domain-containing protein n=1 Tax=uncultured Peptoniphilus sp. TaxID=254354 RepID=UPI002804D285|nr:S-layer homology domain-containing protein [uncultured Peptoniphilus sp.]
MKEKISKIVFLFSAVFLIGFMQIENVNATTYSPSTLDEFRTLVENSQDGDEIDLVKLSNGESFDSVGGGSTDLASIGEINVNKNITIFSSEPEKAVRYLDFSWYRAVFLKNVSFNVSEGNTLTLKGYLYLRGTDDAPVFHGDGNLILTERAHIIGRNGHPAIELKEGKVEVNNLMSFDNSSKYGRDSEKFKSEIIGGDSSSSNGASAIVAKIIEIKQQNLKFKDYPNYVSQGLCIRGGHCLAENGQGGFAINGEEITIDLSGEMNEYATDSIIMGGSGPYGAGAIKGKNIDIECAGNGKIVPGNGIDTDTENARNNFYYGVIEVEEGGTLNFGTNEVHKNNNGLKREESMNYVVGGDNRTIFFNENEDCSTYFKDKNWNNFYPPVILAKDDAKVNVYRGHLQDKGPNANGPEILGKSVFMYNLSISPVIEMDKGTLNIGKENGQTDNIYISASSHVFNTSESLIKSNADVNVYGENTVIEGLTFTSMTISEEKQVGYAKNPIAPKVGASGIKTSGKVFVNAANICGGTISNILAENGSKKDEYRFGSGIVGASDVTLVNGAVVQGYGPIKYLRNKELYNYSRISDNNVSAGYGLENIGNVYIEDSEVHGGDIQTVKGTCTSSIPGFCEGNGKAGDGIRRVKYVEVKGDSLITGGSSVNNYSNNRTIFVDRLQAGSGINEAQNVNIKGNVQVYGGGSSTSAGHGIANSENITLEGDEATNKEPIVYGGACRQTKDTGKEISGSGIYMAKNANIKAGKIEAGNMVYQMYLNNYKDKVHSRTRTGGFNGTSDKAYAISGTGKILIDGDKNFTPEIKSYNSISQVGWIGTKTPIASVGLLDSGALYVGKAKIYSGGDENYRDKNILVSGGKYHVDIFKDNIINSFEEIKDNRRSQGIKYKAKNSVSLFRILNNDKTDYENEEIKKSAAYDDIFLNDFKINLYKEKNSLNSVLTKKAAIRKEMGQGLKTIGIEKIEDLEKMIDDNIILDKTEPTPKPEPTPTPEPEEIIVFKPHDDTPTYKVEAKKIEELENHIKYIFGYPEGTFKPEGKIKRAEVMAIIARGEGYKLSDESKPNYQDAKDKSWYNKYINACTKAGILKEKEGEKLRAEEAITRAELADLISRITNGNDKKSDLTDIKGHWAEEAINQGYGNGILTGYPDKSFKPDNTITRAETIIIINALYNRHPDKDYIDANQEQITKYIDLNKSHWAYYEIMEASESHKFVRVGEHEENWKELIKDLTNN